MKNKIQKGQSLVEYSLILILIAIVVTAAFTVWNANYNPASPYSVEPAPAMSNPFDSAPAAKVQIPQAGIQPYTDWPMSIPAVQTVLKPGDLKNGIPTVPWQIEHDGLIVRGHCIPKNDRFPDIPDIYQIVYWSITNNKHRGFYNFYTNNCAPPILNEIAVAIDEFIARAKEMKFPETVWRALETFGELMLH